MSRKKIIKDMGLEARRKAVREELHKDNVSTDEDAAEEEGEEEL